MEDDYWKLRSRIMWLNEGDANTSYFHITTTNIKRRNKIICYKDNNGQWIQDHNVILKHVLSHVQQMFSTSHITSNWNSIKNDCWSLSTVDLSSLDKPLMVNEITQALFSLKPFKAPGLDDFHPFFYQKYLNITAPPIIKFYQDIFKNQCIPTGTNNTYLYLIPKIPNANNLNNCRPINLCNTLYKIITKIIVNRIRPIIPSLISSMQSSFIKGRKSSDNALIIQELLLHFKKLKGKKDFMLLKINLEKAFDRLKWSFFYHILNYFKFPLLYLSLSCTA